MVNYLRAVAYYLLLQSPFSFYFGKDECSDKTLDNTLGAAWQHKNFGSTTINYIIKYYVASMLPQLALGFMHTLHIHM